MLSIGRIFAGDGWRYLWQQVAVGAEDYYLADVARGETPGRWCGSAARLELGLAGEVTKEQMHRVFGLLVHPSEDVELGRAPRIYRSLDQRLGAARQGHDEAQQQAWDRRAVELAEARAPMERIESERRAHQAGSAETWAEREAVIRRGGERHAVAGFDLCFSPPKSVSVLWAAADRDGREIIWGAHREGVHAALRYLERETAWSRSGYNGIRQIDTTGWVIAAFEHRMSRSGDVQIHTHSAVLNRARCPDGEWRSLDGRAVYRVAASAGALYDRVREAALERDLGVRHETRKPGGAREIVGVDEDLCRFFSSRRVQVEGRVAEMADVYRARNEGAEPSPWTLTQMSRWATLETRQHKKRAEGTPEALARWEAETRAQLGRSLARVWERAIHRELNSKQGDAANGRHAAQQQTPSDEELVGAAVGALDATKSTWTRYDLARQLTLTLPTEPSTDAEGLLRRVDQLVEHALGAAAEQFGVMDLSASPVFDTPTELRRRNDGQSVYSEHGATRYSTRAALAKERAALETACQDDGPRLHPGNVDAVLAAAAQLGDDQTEAVRRLATSGKRMEALVGPAGTGKTSTMRALAAAWKADGRAVIGLAVSETATRILARQAAIRAANTAKLLYEHTHRDPRTRDKRWWRDQYAIAPGSLVILDEASMASRDEIDQLNRLCQQHHAKLLLVGDHQQLASPTTGGLFRLLVEQLGAVELDQVHRFVNKWETDASLALRAANPDVLADYDLRGRIHGGTDADMEDAAFTAALADRARGVSTFLLADTNDAAARLAGRTRDQLVAAGAVDDTRTVDLADENRAGRGDHIVTRDNDRTNRSDRGHFVANRDTWQITSVGRDGTVAVSRVDPASGRPRADDTTVLDAVYVAEHVQLAYAGTVHAAQGATGATTHAIVTASTTRAALHVALTRGREDHAYVICARPEGADRDGPTQDPLAVLAAILERDDSPDERAVLAVYAQTDQGARRLKTLFPLWQDLIATAGRQRWQQAITDACGPELAEQLLASPAWPTLAARLRVIDAADIDSPTAMAGAARRRDFDDADDIAAVLHWRLGAAETNARIHLGDTFAELSPTIGGEMERAITQVAAAMDARTEALSEQVETERPAWAAQLGPLPDDPQQRGDWRRRAGIVAGYREAFDVRPDGPDPIGSSPPVGRPDARAWWQRAAGALDRSEPATLARQPDEHLEAIVERSRAAHRSAPEPVADRLRELYRSLRQARTAEGVARHAGAITASQAAATDAETLARAVVETEAAHQRRKSWLDATARLREHGDAAQAKLDLRHQANADTSTASTSLPALRQRTAQAKARLESMEATLRHTQDLKRRCDEAIARLNSELVLLLTLRPASTRATSAIAAEHRVAERIEHLRAALNHRRFGLNTLRGTDRDAVQTELDRLERSHPPLASPHLRDPRWEQIRTEGNDVDERAVEHHQAQIADEQGRRDQHASIAQACQAERDSRASAYDKLTEALEKRTSPSRHDARDDIMHSPPATTPAHQSRGENRPAFDRPTPLKHDVAPPSIDPPSPAGPSLEP